ncbi:hypothetical protein BO82DRAFT_50313 [Aspergillus uvarum CBS 121591]|uniref:Uncharacterized protein n=1 Tax=Aspergillus uvarum CBS 121591 TaxID=1448315 RepID=A0A319CME2_9EURO|nr:hypothetical protein BO82DRAFT_50313 [Aspergillus uvarum CBS 121591]PYH86656.1 hypothetical protein BO82DRAFT_50313 [Aspergillus uvarum CBS 121591]
MKVKQMSGGWMHCSEETDSTGRLKEQCFIHPFGPCMPVYHTARKIVQHSTAKCTLVLSTLCRRRKRRPKQVTKQPSESERRRIFGPFLLLRLCLLYSAPQASPFSHTLQRSTTAQHSTTSRKHLRPFPKATPNSHAPLPSSNTSLLLFHTLSRTIILRISPSEVKSPRGFPPS